MPDSNAIAGLIESAISGVAGIGRIHRYDRMFTTESEFLAHHSIGDGSGQLVINSCTIVRVSASPGATRPDRRGFQRTTRRDQVYELRFIRGQHDDSASQHQLGDLLDAVFSAFEGETAKSLFLAQGLRYNPLEVTQIGMAGYGNPPTWLVNQGITQLTVQEVIG